MFSTETYKLDLAQVALAKLTCPISLSLSQIITCVIDQHQSLVLFKLHRQVQAL